MPWCNGKVTVPFGCSTALVMNRRPGHAPQPLPPAVDALAGIAAALAEMAIAMSAARPSAIFTSLILRNLVIFIGCPFLWRGHQPGGASGPPLFRSPLLASAAAWVLRSSRRTHQSAAGRPPRAGKMHTVGGPGQEALWPPCRQAAPAGTRTRSSAADVVCRAGPLPTA